MLRVSRRSFRSDYSNHVEREYEKTFCVMKGDRKQSIIMIEYSMRETVDATLEPTIGAQPEFLFPIRMISCLLVTLEPDKCCLRLRGVVRILQVFASWLQLESNSTSFCDSALPRQIPCSVLWKGKVQFECWSYICPKTTLFHPIGGIHESLARLV